MYSGSSTQYLQSVLGYSRGKSGEETDLAGTYQSVTLVTLVRNTKELHGLFSLSVQSLAHGVIQMFYYILRSSVARIRDTAIYTHDKVNQSENFLYYKWRCVTIQIKKRQATYVLHTQKQMQQETGKVLQKQQLLQWISQSAQCFLVLPSMLSVSENPVL